MTRLTPRDKTHAARWAARFARAVVVTLFAGTLVACSDGIDEAPHSTAPAATGTTSTTAPVSPVGTATQPPVGTRTPVPVARRIESLAPTGVPIADRVLGGFRRQDAAELTALTVPTDVPCMRDGSTRLVCRGDALEGTVYPAFLVGFSCNPGYNPLSEMEQFWRRFIEFPSPFWAIVRDPGVYLIIFAAGPSDRPMAVLVLGQSGFTFISGSCTGPVGEVFPSGTDFLVPPR